MIDFLKTLIDPVQLIGYTGMLCAVLSFQCKKNRNFFLWQTACGLFFALQFALLGKWAGCLSNIFAILRGVAFAGGERYHRRWVLWELEGAFLFCFILSVTAFSEPEWVAALLLVAQGGGTLAMWSDKGKTIRLFQLLVSSPIWLVHNTVYAFSMGGILCEIFNMVSVIISFIRFRKDGFEK